MSARPIPLFRRRESTPWGKVPAGGRSAADAGHDGRLHASEVPSERPRADRPAPAERVRSADVGRLPFDPDKTRAKRAAAAKGDPAPSQAAPAWSVSELAARIGDALSRGLPGAVRVEGEISGLRDRTHAYFDLKDAGAVVSCVMFASSVRKSGVTLENGVSLIATGRVEFYAPSGRTSLIIDKVELRGRGALEAQFRALCDELRGLGWFDPARKRPLPTFPRRVAVVTSRTGAALQDVLDTARRRCPAVEFLIVDARVQGSGAAGEVASAIDALGAARERLGIDAILVTRGGGSMEDLWAFNERVVAEAIVRCPAPVVAAIGHETDTTIAELVADERCATPTQAAVRLVPDRGDLTRQLGSLAGRLHMRTERALAWERERALGLESRLASGVRTGLRDARVRLLEGAGRLERQRPAAAQARREARWAAAAQRLEFAVRRRVLGVDLVGVEGRLHRVASRRLRDAGRKAHALERELKAMGPFAVLERGYSWTEKPGGGLVRSPGDVAPGDRVITRLADGSFGSVVEGDGVGPATPPRTPAARPSRVKRRPSGRGQMDLFGERG
ncbi:MAG: exodeoxyribonuclease VII large subunit [Phycisphaerales bacterium]|nr:MAG: exodeoxyribonuclease VII large subunit [Phycisphaerales bacterium]